MCIDHTLITELLSDLDSPTRMLIDQMPGGFLIYRANDEEEIIYANRALLYIFGCQTLEEFRQWTGNSFRGIVHPADLDEVEESIRQQIADSQYDLDYVEYRIIRKDGELRWIEDYGHFIHDEAAGDIFYVFMGDATEKKRRQEQELYLLKQEQLHRLKIIEGLSIDYDSIFYCELDPNHLKPFRISSRVQGLFSSMQANCYTEFISRYLHTWVCTEDQALFALATSPDYIKKKLSRDKTFLINYRILNHDKQEYLQLRIVNVGSGKPVSQIVLGCRSVDAELTRRIEQRQILENALRQAQEAISVKNIFLANMSHDIRTPMNAIAGFTSLAKNYLEEPQKLRDYLERIETANDQLLQLINDVLEISRMESGKIHVEQTLCSLTTILKNAHMTLFPRAAAKNLDFSLDLTGITHDNVFADTHKLTQILLQLGDNAIKYTETGGQVVIGVREQDLPGRDFALYQFLVQDTGVGINHEFLAHIFEPFERQQNTTLSGVYGAGLGLPIVHGLVRMMEGQIDIDSAPGQGSRFTVTLNLRLSKERAAQPEPVETSAPLSASSRLLLVEDNEINLEIEVELLEDAGFSVDTAQNGQIALEILQNAAPGTYSLVLMDIQMPVMNGYQAAQAIRHLPDPTLAKIPIVALSANAFEEDRKASTASGMNVHLAKPIDIDQVLETIKKLTHGYCPSDCS